MPFKNGFASINLECVLNSGRLCLRHSTFWHTNEFHCVYKVILKTVLERNRLAWSHHASITFFPEIWIFHFGRVVDWSFVAHDFTFVYSLCVCLLMYWFNWFAPFDANWLINLVQLVFTWQKTLAVCVLVRAGWLHNDQPALELNGFFCCYWFVSSLDITNSTSSKLKQLKSMFFSNSIGFCCQ